MRHLPAFVLGALLLLAIFPAGAATTPDPSRKLVDAFLASTPDPTSLSWWYARGLVFLGADQLGQRAGDPSYLAFAQRWAESRVLPSGELIDQQGAPVELWALDHIMPGALLARLLATTGDPRYRLTLDAMRAALQTWPRSSNGGFWHTMRSNGQLWADGTYMSTTFLLAYGRAVDDGGTAREEAVRQLLAYAEVLQDARTGLVFHAWHEPRKAAWANRATGRSPAFWCRANGWYGMALVNVLDELPTTHPRRARLTGILRHLAVGLARYQDPKSRLWFQVMDKGTLRANWTETSCSAMHALVLARGAKRGWLASGYLDKARAARQAVEARVRIQPDGLVGLEGAVAGTSVGNAGYYLAQPRPVNDWHGVGAFVLMEEEFTRLGIRRR